MAPSTAQRGLITGKAIVFRRAEITALADYASTQGKARTYRVERDTRGVLHVVEPSGRLTRLSPEVAS